VKEIITTLLAAAAQTAKAVDEAFAARSIE
jgi:hypothetical protein